MPLERCRTRRGAHACCAALADVWTDSVSDLEYCVFLNKLLYRISKRADRYKRDRVLLSVDAIRKRREREMRPKKKKQKQKNK